MEYQAIIDFWFKEVTPQQKWKKDPAFDQMLKERFLDINQAAANCELFGWRINPLGRLAEIIVLDQFSRNIFRDQAESFSQDSLALALAQEAVACNAPAGLDTEQRSFLYMPYMHSESPLVHQQAVQLFSEEGLENSYNFEIRHKEIIDRFGRYPHRNAVLGRQSTQAELEFLEQPGSSF
ncbi:DUF924 family protein [Motiliproteus sp. MSK22-1]|uniref:DUF924 family protein n=1 Tax=Motiliproteus sp. MSK22-1 TaxID=1897630 RepID=UPI00097605EE|nr:DUF924 family protein [Motiliproteus sp. MSK22-1]OMH25296.1 hypothetical protein BGP75_26210 [Motiliproteus sp. MSK22-1]